MIECISTQTGKRLVPKDKVRFRPCAYALVQHAGKLLLVMNRVTHLYALPGGEIELGERMTDTLHREVREETGIEISVDGFCRHAEGFFYYDPLDEAYHSIMFFFWCTPKTFEFSDISRVDGIEGDPEWIDLADLKADSIFLGETILEILRTPRKSS